MLYCRSTCRRRGFSVLELLIAAAISSTIAVVGVWLLVFSAKMTGVSSAHNSLAVYARNRMEFIKNAVRSGTSIRMIGDKRLAIANPDATTSEFEYIDRDDDPETVRDNVLVYRETPDSEPREILKYVHWRNDVPIFQASADNVLTVQLRLGLDNGGSTSSLQSVDINTRVVVRNR